MDAAEHFVRVSYIDPCTFEEWRDAVEDLRRNPVFLFQRQIGVLVDRTHVGQT